PNGAVRLIESSNSLDKRVMVRAAIPTADFAVFTEPARARAWARERDGQVAVKADGLARGKGVVVCASVDEANAAIDSMLVESRFGRSGSTIVLEEKLTGPELSVLGITDGKDVVALAPARDFKRAHDGDRGPNTGGMGAYSPPMGVGGALLDEVLEKVLRPADGALVKTGFQIRGLAEMPRGVQIFHAGTRFEPGHGLVTDGGRVVTSVALGDTVAEAREKALAGARQVRFQGAFYRSDIALEA